MTKVADSQSAATKAAETLRGPTVVPIDELQKTWTVLGERLDAFLTAWRSGPPNLAEFVPEGPPARRRLILAELIKVDLERRLSDGADHIALEAYLDHFPELRAGGIPVDLLFEDFHLRQQRGAAPSFEDYQRRFPSEAPALLRLLGHKSSEYAPTAIQKLDAPPEEMTGTVAGFQILRTLGQGAFAKVYLAWQANLQRTVALKDAPDRGTEPQTLAQLDHINIVRVYDLHPAPTPGRCLMSMAFLPGGTLDDVLQHVHSRPREEWDGALFLAAVDQALKTQNVEPAADSATRQRIANMTWPEVVAWVGARMGAALDYAHRRDILHRDIKPANILLTSEGVPQLADFNVGTAKLKDPGPKAIFGGSLPYMAPEQLEVMETTRTPEDLDGRCDLYALGMTLWKMLTGQRPFTDEQHTGDYFDTIAALIKSRRGGVPAAAETQLPPNCPREVVKVLKRSLAGDRNDRFATGADFSKALELCLYPETVELLQADATGFGALVRRHPIWTMLPLGLAPNLVASVINIRYNQAAVIDARPDAQETFHSLIWIINGILFPAGLALFAMLALPVSRAVRSLARSDSTTSHELPFIRQRCLRLGTVAALVGVGCWVLAGVCWPTTLDWLVGGLPWHAHLHFLASLTVCGLIAAVYPFFLVSLMAVRYLMPVLLRAGQVQGAERTYLASFERQLVPYLMLSAAVPLVAIAALVFIESQDKASMKALVLLGLVGCGFAYLLERRIRGTIRALTPLYES